MTAAEAEAIIRRSLDGWFFTLEMTRGEESIPHVYAKRVPADFIFPYHAVEDRLEAAEKLSATLIAKKHRPWTDEETEPLVSMRQAGGRWDVIARTIKRCTRAIKERYAIVAQERSLPPPVCRAGKFSKLTDEQKAEIIRRREAGETYGTICREMGVSEYIPRDYYNRYQTNRRQARQREMYA